MDRESLSCDGSAIATTSDEEHELYRSVVLSNLEEGVSAVLSNIIEEHRVSAVLSNLIDEEEGVSANVDEEDDDVSITSQVESSTPPITETVTSAPGTSTAAESYCDCFKVGRVPNLCLCGEVDSDFDWTWDEKSKSAATIIKPDQREVSFHVDFSCGTAAVRGTKPMKSDQYFWELKMTTPVYGTDMMIGVGTHEMDLNRHRHEFCSMLGKDSESWGLSYNGSLQYQGNKTRYSAKYGQGTIIGVHLDMWHGTLTFFKNRIPLGVAFRGLQGKTVYPMLSSTAARSGMKVIKCQSFTTSLQFMCCQVIRKLVPMHLDVLDAVPFPPGLRLFLQNNISWLLQSQPRRARYKRSRSMFDDEEDQDADIGEGCSHTQQSKRMKALHLVYHER